MSIKKNSILTITASILAMASLSNALAADAAMPSEETMKFFVEGHIGYTHAMESDTVTVDPSFTQAGYVEPVNNNELTVSDSSANGSITGKLAAGMFFSDMLFFRGSYNYLGNIDVLGKWTDTNVPAVTRTGTMNVKAHSVMAELGAVGYLSDELFVEGSINLGLGILSSDGKIEYSNGAPTYTVDSNTNTGLAAGLGLGFGYDISEQTSLVLSGDYTWLGEAQTGNGVNNDYAKSDLSALRGMIGLRHSF